MKKIQLKKTFTLCLAMAVLAFTVSGCKNDSNEPEPPVEMPWVQQIYPLAGTKWQVSKVMHTKTGVESPIFVGDELCTPFVPILDFETNTTGYIYVDYWLDTNNFRGWPFSLHDDMIYKKYTQEGLPSNIANFLFASGGKEILLSSANNRYIGTIGYRLEGTLLKFYQHNDGFFFFDPANDSISHMYPCSNDSNWYNCVVWEEVK